MQGYEAATSNVIDSAKRCAALLKPMAGHLLARKRLSLRLTPELSKDAPAEVARARHDISCALIMIASGRGACKVNMTRSAVKR